MFNDNTVTLSRSNLFIKFILTTEKFALGDLAKICETQICPMVWLAFPSFPIAFFKLWVIGIGKIILFISDYLLKPLWELIQVISGKIQKQVTRFVDPIADWIDETYYKLVTVKKMTNLEKNPNIIWSHYNEGFKSYQKEYRPSWSKPEPDRIFWEAVHTEFIMRSPLLRNYIRYLMRSKDITSSPAVEELTDFLINIQKEKHKTWKAYQAQKEAWEEKQKIAKAKSLALFMNIGKWIFYPMAGIVAIILVTAFVVVARIVWDALLSSWDIIMKYDWTIVGSFLIDAMYFFIALLPYILAVTLVFFIIYYTVTTFYRKLEDLGFFQAIGSFFTRTTSATGKAFIWPVVVTYKGCKTGTTSAGNFLSGAFEFSKIFLKTIKDNHCPSINWID